MIGVERKRAIDYPALSIHIRQAVGERDWGRFLERIALPKPAVIMAPNATDQEKDKYIDAAERVEDGMVSVWPSGSSLTDFMGGSRGQDPFSAFIRHQEEKVVLLSTGGTLTSLAQADTGSLAGGAQMDVWREIVKRDAALVAQAVNRMVREYLARVFPGRPQAAEFGFDTGKKLTAQEAANVAATLRQAGWAVDRKELEEAVGFSLEREEDQPSGQFPLPGAHLTNKKNDITTSDTKSGSEANGLLEAFAKDSSAAAEAVKKLLENLSPDAAAAFLKDIPSLLPDDPAMAAIIAEEMAKEFGEAVKNKTDANGMEHADSGEDGGQFVKKDYTPASGDQVKAFLANPPDKIKPEDFDALLTAGFTDRDGDGNKVKYGELLRDHINKESRGDKDLKNRKEKLGVAVRFVREARPIPSGDPKKPNERVYLGLIKGKAYLAVADEHNEIGALKMVSYRRDRENDE